jgi:hypothetical protein
MDSGNELSRQSPLFNVRAEAIDSLQSAEVIALEGDDAASHTMLRILGKINHHKERISTGPLFTWLADETLDGLVRLSFAPSMLYYLMGFKDVLGALYRDEPKCNIEHAINAYCGEDAEHWRWYLDDLQKLGFSLTTWGQDIPSFCNEVWSPATSENRKAIFRLVDYANACRDPLYAMCLIFVFEATGVVFIGHTRKAAVALGMDEQLTYFGRIHFEEEFGHSVQAHDLAGETLSPEVYPLVSAMVDDLFACYDRLFSAWYEHRDHYRSGCRLANQASIV